MKQDSESDRSCFPLSKEILLNFMKKQVSCLAGRRQRDDEAYEGHLKSRVQVMLGHLPCFLLKRGSPKWINEMLKQEVLAWCDFYWVSLWYRHLLCLRDFRTLVFFFLYTVWRSSLQSILICLWLLLWYEAEIWRKYQGQHRDFSQRQGSFVNSGKAM